MLVFVYGTLKKGHGNCRHYLEGKARYMGDAVTVDPYSMAGEGVPMVFPNPRGLPVRGEVWDIGDPVGNPKAAATLGGLDRLEGNGFMYQRAERAVRMLTDHLGVMPLPRDAGDVVQAWIYEGMLGRRWFPGDDARLHWLNSEGVLEWDYPDYRRPVRTQDDEQVDA